MAAEVEVNRLQLQTTAHSDGWKGKSRIAVLATPKESKATYWTDFSPNVVWGNQDPMWPVSQAALQAEPSSRLEELARPKQSHRDEHCYIPEFQFSCGRTSQIWKVKDATKRPASVAPRVRELARHKTVPAGYLEHRPGFQYSCGRPSAIWSVSYPAQGCQPRPRTISLSEPKRTHSDYQPGRPTIQSIVSSAAKTYSATDHIDALAVAKKRPVGPFRDPEWVVSRAAKQASPSDRVGELSKSKKLAEGYAPCRSVLWRVSTGARNAVASTRMEELAKPIIRETMDHVQFNPDAFSVSETARKYRPTPRVEELAKPLQRGSS